MKLITLIASATWTAFSWPVLAVADDGKRSSNIYNPRYTQQLCPPEYPENRDKIRRFIDSHPRGEQLRSFFGDAVPTDSKDISLLTDDNDATACEALNRLYDRAINRQARLFDGAQAEYVYDFTFYEGGEFYFIIIGAGLRVQEDPNNPGKKRLLSDSAFPRGMTIRLKHDFGVVPLSFLDDADLCVDEPGNYLLENELVRQVCAAETEEDTQAR